MVDMDWLTFFSTSFKALLSWQVAAVIALFVLKRQIAAVFVGLGDRLATMKVPGVEVTFAERVNKIEEKLPAPVAVELATTLEPKQLETRSELSKLLPAYVISHAWLRLQQTLYEAVETLHPGAGADGNQDLRAYLDLARLHGLLLPDEEPVVNELLVLRNQAVRPMAIPTVTSTDALRYYDLAEALRDNIKERVERAREHASARRADPHN
jgi:hypothetical protein